MLCYVIQPPSPSPYLRVNWLVILTSVEPRCWKKEEVSNWLSALCVRWSLSAPRHCGLSTSSEFQNHKGYFEFHFCLWPTLQWQMYPFIILHLGRGRGRRKYYVFHRVCVRIKWADKCKMDLIPHFLPKEHSKEIPKLCLPFSYKTTHELWIYL